MNPFVNGTYGTAGLEIGSKTALLEEVHRRVGVQLSSEALTIGFARRAAAYKRAELILSDPDKLVQITQAAGPIQLLFAGKAHPQDQLGKDIIHRICDIARRLQDQIKIVYLPGHDMELAALLTAGVDVWLNTPLRPQEASGTSGMKAAHNGVPSFSVLDGWWIEGHIEGVTGWSIGTSSARAGADGQDTDGQDADDLYRKLGADILPMFYQNREQWLGIMRQAIAFNASFFNTHRMVQQYAVNAYL